MFPSVRISEWRWAIGASALIVVLASVPYLVCWAIVPAGSNYTGLLINPIDGHSYLAKIGQGAAGSWLVRLPYTAEPHEPALIYTYLLALGHLVPSGSPTSLLAVYHLARVSFGLVLMLTVYGASSHMSSDVRFRRFAVLVVGLSSGVGWLVGDGPDLTVPESITFPSLLVNAHFGLTVLLMVSTVLALTVAAKHERWWPIVVLGGVLLTMIQPFATAVVGLVGLTWFIVESVRAHTLQRPPLVRLSVFSLTAVPIIGYLFWLMRANPHFQQWMSQNVTPSPPIGQWLVGYGLLIPLAAAGIWRGVRRQAEADRLLLIWLGIHLLVMLTPIDLQRRLSTGLHLPLAFLAAIGVWEVLLPHVRRRVRRLATLGLLLLLVFPSNLVVMLAGVGAVASGNPYLVISDAELEALNWLQDHASPDTIVLTDIEFGTLVPSWGGGARVVYGHPFETLDAATLGPMVYAFFSGDMTAAQREELLHSQSIDLIVVRSDRFAVPALPGYVRVWRNDGVVILQLGDP